MKISEMSYYPIQLPGQAGKRDNLGCVEDTEVLQRITATRRAVMEYCSQCSTYIYSNMNKVDWNLARQAFIASSVGSALLVTAARKKSRTPIKMVLYPTIVGGLVSTACYPNEVSAVLKDVLPFESLPTVPLPPSLSEYVSLLPCHFPPAYHMGKKIFELVIYFSKLLIS